MGIVYFDALSWLGEFKEDKVYGKGTIKWREGEFKGEKYFGEFL